MNVENNQNNLEGIEIYQICECDAVAANSLEEAYEWYKQSTGIPEEELYPYDEIETVNLDSFVLEEEGKNDKLISVRSLLSEVWKGEPVIVVSTY